MTDRYALAIAAVGAPLAASLLLATAPRRAVRGLALAAALAVAAAGGALSGVSLAEPGAQLERQWVIVDAAGGVLVAVISLVGLATALVSPTFLRTASSALLPSARRERVYYALLFAFWAILVAVPLAGNLGAAWLVLEATTAVSAVLVGFGGKGRALEAAWKYLVLTSLGLGFALLGTVVLAAGQPNAGLGGLTWSSLGAADASTALVAYVLVLAGLAAKVGWAPVHNWLPDAHSEAPPPVSALLSGALLPAALLVAWRTEDSLSPAIGSQTARDVVIAFGLASLAVAVPFLWRPLAWKRLLAYSSLEHMGVIALGIGFGTPLALAGVVVHLLGHALAKALGFYAAVPLLALEPRAAGHPVRGVGSSEPKLAAALGVSLGTLAGIPPLPLFASEVLIVAGGFTAGRPWAAGAAAILLGLGFLGLGHALVEMLVGRRRRPPGDPLPGLGGVTALAGAALILLLALSAAAWSLPSSGLVEALLQGAP